MNYNSKLQNRKSMRLQGWDYSNPRMYFITTNVQNHCSLFGRLKNSNIELNEIGLIVKQSWLWIENHFQNVSLDEWILMPDHLHGIIVINDYQSKGGLQSAPTRRKPLGQLIAAFKTVSTKQINILCGSTGNQIWQRSYYDRIIRNEDELNKIRNYIKQNPQTQH